MGGGVLRVVERGQQGADGAVFGQKQFLLGRFALVGAAAEFGDAVFYGRPAGGTGEEEDKCGVLYCFHQEYFPEVSVGL